MTKEVMIAKKDYVCDFCGDPIKKGFAYRFKKGRVGRVENRKQVGVFFWSARHCFECVGTKYIE